MNPTPTAALPYSITGTANQFLSTRYDESQEMGGKERGLVKFFAQAQGANDRKNFGITNMKQPSQIEAGHQFVVNSIELKVWQRVADEDVSTEFFFQNIMQTLYACGSLRFKKSGIDQIGEFPLRKFIPNTIAPARVQTLAPVLIDLTNAVSMEIAVDGAGNAVLDESGRKYFIPVRKPMVITLPEQQNFSVELEWDIPQTFWDGTSWRELEGEWKERAGRIPKGTVVGIILNGVETSLQG
jgi:hypothetical protein